MPRRPGRVVRREVAPDAKYNSRLVSKIVNVIMKQGKKSVAEQILYDSLEIMANKTNGDALKLFKQAIDNVKPAMEVKSRRVGGASYQVPVEIRPNRKISLALRWIVDSAYKRAGHSMEEKLAAELLDASNNAGGAVKKREDTHRMAEANKAFAHYRW
ncbi:MAG: 30S ribosomal protein S7 [Leptospirales bacterium]